ncbi:MAG: hypothetical protein ACTSXQ_06310 [Alphaproteobacteria bacterium]
MFGFLLKSKKDTSPESNGAARKNPSKKSAADLNGKYLEDYPYNGSLCCAGAGRSFDEIEGTMVKNGNNVAPLDLLPTFNPYPDGQPSITVPIDSNTAPQQENTPSSGQES